MSHDKRIDGAVDLFKTLAELPTYTSATFLTDDVINIQTSVRSHVLKKKLKNNRTVTLTGHEKTPVLAGPPIELPDKTIEFYSTQEQGLKGVLKTVDGGKQRIIEVWKWAAGVRLLEKDVTKECGDFLDDETWGSPTFSHDRSSLVFTAQRLPPKDEKSEMPQDVFARHTFTPTWGELNRTTTFPTPFVLHFDDPNKAELLPIISRALDATTSFAQAVFLSEFEGLILVGHDTMEDGRRLGIVYCTNRRNGLWLAPVPKRGGDGATFDELTRISAEGRSTRSPRILPRARDDMDGKDLLIYLSNPVGGVHNSCATLHARRVAYDEASVEDDVLVGPVWKPAHIGGFPGLYLQSLPARPFMFVSGRAYVVFSTLDRSQQVNHRVRLDLDNKPVESEAILDRSGYASSVILGTDGKAQMVFVSSDMLSPQRIYSVKFSSHDQIEAEHQLLPSFVQPRVEHLLQGLFIHDVPTNSPKVETIVLGPALSDSPAPLLFWPHGGPHSATTTAFSPTYAAFAAAGFMVALINYTGSIGYGEKYVQELRGKCGELDVQDCVDFVKYWEDKVGGLGPGKTFVQGGSHGGFLTAHLTSRYPDLFTAAVLRNPVISLGENPTVTDIPDWNFTELDLPFSFSASDPRPSITPTPEQYAFLQSRSPITLAHQVKAHTLLLVGLEDRRVPPSQAKAWYHTLKGKADWIRKQNALGTVAEAPAKEPELHVECLAFEGEGHAIDGVEADLASFEAGLRWLARWAKF